MCIVLIFSEMLLSFFFTSFKPSEGVIIGATSFPEAFDKYVLKDRFLQVLIHTETWMHFKREGSPSPNITYDLFM